MGVFTAALEEADDTPLPLTGGAFKEDVADGRLVVEEEIGESPIIDGGNLFRLEGMEWVGEAVPEETAPLLLPDDDRRPATDFLGLPANGEEIPPNPILALEAAAGLLLLLLFPEARLDSR